MTKHEELEVLRDAVKRLGPDSYCGPWLDSVLGAVERDIKADLPPMPTVDATRKYCADMVADAKLKATAVWMDMEIKEAKAKMDRVATRERFKDSIRLACRTSLEALEKL